MIFSIAMDAEYLSYVKSIATFAPTFYGYIISVLASVGFFRILKKKLICKGLYVLFFDCVTTDLLQP